MTTEPVLPELTERHTVLVALCLVVGFAASALAVTLTSVNHFTLAVLLGGTVGVLLSLPVVLWLRRHADPLDAWLADRLLPWIGFHTGVCLGWVGQNLQQAVSPLWKVMFLLLIGLTFGGAIDMRISVRRRIRLWSGVNIGGSLLAMVVPMLLHLWRSDLDVVLLRQMSAVYMVIFLGVIPALLMLRLGVALPKGTPELDTQQQWLRRPEWLPVRICLLVLAVIAILIEWQQGSPRF